MMHGRPVERRSVVQEPISVVTRGSTGYDAMSDVHVAQAVKFIRDSIASGEVVDVADAVRAAHCSRRYLERHFRSGLGRSVHDELMLVRMERVKELLETTALPIGEIAGQVGYTRPSRLAAMFRRVTGMTMRAWRGSLAADRG
jgi:LacI family transcriptional regulator